MEKKSISHKEICERSLPSILGEKTIKKGGFNSGVTRDAKVDYVFINEEEDEYIAFEVEAPTPEESLSDLHLLGHMIWLVLVGNINYKGRIKEVYWLTCEENYGKLKEGVELDRDALRTVLRNGYPIQECHFHPVKKEIIEMATKT